MKAAQLFDLTGEVALVTGASSGLGERFAQTLAANGAKVVVAARRVDRLERLVEIIAAAFIRQTRFDPRRKAATEQQLYDAIPDTLRTLRKEGETNLEINGYRARVTRDELLGAGQRLFDGAAQNIGALENGDRVLVDTAKRLFTELRE